MDPDCDYIIDSFTLIDLLGFAAYFVYWVVYHLLAGRRLRLWIGMAAFVAWCVATYVCFLRLLLGCMAGLCAGRMSPFLEFAILYALSSAALILLMHRYRGERTSTDQT